MNPHDPAELPRLALTARLLNDAAFCRQVDELTEGSRIVTTATPDRDLQLLDVALLEAAPRSKAVIAVVYPDQQIVLVTAALAADDSADASLEYDLAIPGLAGTLDLCLIPDVGDGHQPGMCDGELSTSIRIGTVVDRLRTWNDLPALMPA